MVASLVSLGGLGPLVFHVPFDVSWVRVPLDVALSLSLPPSHSQTLFLSVRAVKTGAMLSSPLSLSPLSLSPFSLSLTRSLCARAVHTFARFVCARARARSTLVPGTSGIGGSESG